MPRFDRLTVRRAFLAGAACILATLSCGREVTGPSDAFRMARGFTFDARFGPEGLPNGVASDLVPFTKVRVLLVNAAGTNVVDRVVDFPSNVQEVPLSFDVPLASGSGSAGESMVLSLAFVNAAGDTVFRGGPQPVQVVPSAPGSVPPPAPQIPVTFTGTGSTAGSVRISPRTLTVVAGDPFAFTAVARDAQLATIANTPIGWRSLQPTIANLAATGAGAGTALPSRGNATIVAQLLTGPADTVVLTVTPKAGALALVSGNNQNGSLSTMLAQPVVVRVNATDNLPMAGVTVTFAAGSGGSVGAPTVVTNVNGLAQTTWTLGNALGAQTLTATAAGVTGAPVTFNALAPQLVQTHHYPINGDLNDVVGTANATPVGGATLANGVLTLDGSTGYAQFGAQIVPTTGSYTVSLFVRNRTALTQLAEYISQGQSVAPGFFIGHSASGQIRATDSWAATGAAAPPIDGLFHHLVLVVDSVANQSRLFVDGSLSQTLASRIVTAATGANTRLGRQFDPFTEYLNGDIDEVRVFRGALDAAAVAAL